MPFNLLRFLLGGHYLNTNDIQIADEKLSLLYFLSRFDFSVKAHFITSFFSESNIMDYFLVQQLLHELTAADLIKREEAKTGLMSYSLRSEGFHLLAVFKDRILPYIKTHIDAYASENKLKIKSDAQISADFEKTPDGLFLVHLNLHEIDFPLIDLTVTAVSRDQAKDMCNNWINRAPDIYNTLLNHLIPRD